MRLRVMLITGSYPPMKCGVGEYTKKLAEALAALPEVSVSVLTDIRAREYSHESNVEVMPLIKAWRIREVFQFLSLLRRWKPDIVHIQYPTQGYYENRLLPWLIPLAAFLLLKKVVQTWHEFYGDPPDLKLLLKAIVPMQLVVVRPQYWEHLHPKLQKILRKEKITFIRNGSTIHQKTLSKPEQADERRKYIKQQKRLIVFFGFVYPHKGTELLFDIADPELDQIVIAGQFGDDAEYHKNIIERASTSTWTGKITFTGFLSPDDAATLMAVADAVILPFRTGGGEWNTSIHGAVLQGAFVLTTSQALNGFDEARNVYYAKIDDVLEMKAALNRYAGKRRGYDPAIDIDEWQQIAAEHYSLYKSIVLPNNHF